MSDETVPEPRGVAATYRPQFDPDYAGNPFIEALPEVCDDDGATRGMQRLLRVTAAERALPRHHRLQMLGRIKHFMQPLGFHVNLFHRISAEIRRGYVHRNPASPAFVRELLRSTAELSSATVAYAKPRSTPTRDPVRQRIGPGSGLTLIGSSGVGKTHAVEAVLRCYEQVIRHVGLKGPISTVHQIAWLKLSIPPDGSTKALCIDYFEAVDEILGTGYVRSYVTTTVTQDTLMSHMGRISFIHGLGLLVIDELQNLNVAKAGGAEKMMNFFKLLRDVMRVPLVVVGTPEAVRLLSEDFQTARRNSGQQQMTRLRDDEEFRFFCESLFDAQYLQQPIELTDEILRLLYDVSQGIADIVVQVFKLAQERALAAGIESLSIDLFREAYELDLSLMHPFLDDLRRGKQVEAQLFDRAVAASKAATFPQPQGATEPAEARGADDAPGGVAKRRARRRNGEPSSCELVRVVEDGTRKQISAHDALAAAGFIRALGAEALGQ